ncbi:MAG TPA: gamma-glutamyl-gamma-aminobutyrate hydrolase family protein [Kofleriaceae bacterium]|nr:gamma-glutamyl-gamma-aminobutyrate hydrolase family protein [Kofleriaceae bacterium]
MARRILLIDCYLDDPGAGGTFAPLLTGAEVTVARAPREPVAVDPAAFDAVIISGSAASVVEPPSWAGPLEPLVRRAAAAAVPVLGVCFGHQIIARALWGRGAVRLSPTPELGWLEITRTGASDPLFDGVAARFPVFCSHQDEVVDLPAEATVLATSGRCSVQSYRVSGRPIWAVQFHAEMSLAEASAVVDRKAELYPERAIDPAALRAAAVDTTDLARRLFDNFLAQRA